MSKDSYWFRHDSTAGRALKMRKMAHIYGHEGKGLYWDVVEILRDQEYYLFESDESSLQMLCDLVGFKDENRFITWFNDCLKIGLFELNDKYFFCPPLSENMKNWEVKKSNGSKGGRPPKTETETESKPKPKPNGNHKRREEESIEDKRKEYKEVNLHPLQLYISENLKNVSRIKTQLTFEECERLVKEFDKTVIRETLTDLENFKEAPKKYTSVNLTLRKWIKKSLEFKKLEPVTGPTYKPFSDD